MGTVLIEPTVNVVSLNGPDKRHGKIEVFVQAELVEQARVSGELKIPMAVYKCLYHRDIVRHTGQTHSNEGYGGIDLIRVVVISLYVERAEQNIPMNVMVNERCSVVAVIDFLRIVSVQELELIVFNMSSVNKTMSTVDVVTQAKSQFMGDPLSDSDSTAEIGSVQGCV